ncbi:fasciclin domain-containing protein [Nonlabens agnitus]|uniref:Beta-Ig-H3/fasciclin n=1 Tax=Nonlabens agnitus TaxID=870484 RepID=A0A2S9WS67_9FLAO|nr:beta-Ig-H3/fasciclin [Nonlabens agnitus]
MNFKNILRVGMLSAAIAIVSCGPSKSMEGDKMMNNEKTVMVGGAAMYPSKNIVENAVNSKDHTTLVAAVKAADLVGTLQGEGPFTVFAPTNAAFDKLPTGTVESLLKPESKSALQGVLTYHVVAGNYSAKKIIDAINQNNGSFTVTTVNGQELEASLKGGKVILTDSNGGTSTVTIADVNQSNGVIHVVDTVLLPA